MLSCRSRLSVCMSLSVSVCPVLSYLVLSVLSLLSVLSVFSASLPLCLAACFLDVFHRFCFWRRSFWKLFPILFEEFLNKLHQVGMQDRPAGAMTRSAANLGWMPSGRFLHHHWFGFIDWLRSTKFLGFALWQTWMRTVWADLKGSRPGFQIAAVDIQGMRNLFCKFIPLVWGQSGSLCAARATRMMS